MRGQKWMETLARASHGLSSDSRSPERAGHRGRQTLGTSWALSLGCRLALNWFTETRAAAQLRGGARRV